MTINLIFVTMTFRKKVWSETELLQQQEIQEQMEANRLKLQKLGYVSHLI
ncbi:MAG TPA: YrzI family small protein [Niallia sp.]|nr:YrzI family small protein [Niallia sp.]